ncbi:MAG: hypothetical protein KF734_13875 [Saprospiraceae bacterium]|nr:hypothetical protein [Saprospiraceae bacterium]
MMNTTRFFSFILFGGLLVFTTMTCQKENPEVEVNILFQDAMTTQIGNDDRRLDFTVVVTQLGNTFYRDYTMTFTKINNSSVVLDSYHTTLPTAREFVKHSIQPLEPGFYMANITLKKEGVEYGFGKGIEVK